MYAKFLLIGALLTSVGSASAHDRQGPSMAGVSPTRDHTMLKWS